VEIRCCCSELSNHSSNVAYTAHHFVPVNHRLPIISGLKMAVSPLGTFFIIFFIILFIAAAGWVIFTQLRARRLGVCQSFPFSSRGYFEVLLFRASCCPTLPGFAVGIHSLSWIPSCFPIPDNARLRKQTAAHPSTHSPPRALDTCDQQEPTKVSYVSCATVS
jgi:hypothetical protein